MRIWSSKIGFIKCVFSDTLVGFVRLKRRCIPKSLFSVSVGRRIHGYGSLGLTLLLSMMSLEASMWSSQGFHRGFLEFFNKLSEKFAYHFLSLLYVWQFHLHDASIGDEFHGFLASHFVENRLKYVPTGFQNVQFIFLLR